MSKVETPLTRNYWKSIGGLLIEEFLLVPGTAHQAPRRLDGLIVLGEPTRISSSKNFSIEGRDVIAIQTKASRIGMYLMGQCLFSLRLIEAMNPNSARSVAICNKDDAVMRPLLESYEGCEVVVYEDWH